MSDKREVVQGHIFNALELSNDIYRNSSDSEFVKNGGELIYCFDATIFNIFFDNEKWHHATTSAYSAPWRKNNEWLDIQAQSALIAAEHLLSEVLPGAANGKIYLTPWHLHELADSIEILTNQFMNNLEGNSEFRNQILQETRRKLDVIAAFNAYPADGPTDAQIRKDARLLSNSLNRAAVRRFMLTRYAANVLVNCPETERMDQIRRIVSRPLRDRIRSIQDLFPLDEAEANDDLKLETKKWHRRLMSEEHQIPPDKRGRRSERGKMSDAQSLTLVRWAGQRVPAHQRMLFVTADSILFNTYRRWWVDNSIDEPFLLRRAQQYAPIFNLSDSQNDVSIAMGHSENVGNLFAEIQDAVETSLLPFNLAMMAGPGRRRNMMTIMRGREHLAIRAQDSRNRGGTLVDSTMSFFLDHLDDDWFDGQSRKISAIKAIFRQIERMGIGFFHDTILRRLNDNSFLTGINKADLQTAESREGVLKFLTYSIDALNERVRGAWLPVAIDFCREFFKTGPTGTLRRVPDTLFRGPYNKITIYSVKAPEAGANDIEDVDWSQAPENAFMLAAVVAMQRHQWWKAEEFAEQAIAATHRRPTDRRLGWDVKFLSAQTKRFRFGSMHPLEVTSSETAARHQDPSERGAKVWHEGEAILTRSIHDLRGGPTGSIEALMLFRALSERAALHIFFAVSQMRDLDKADRDRIDRAERHLHRAKADILECLTHEPHGDQPKDFEAPIEAVIEQVLHNIASLHAALFALSPRFEFKVLPEFDGLVDRVVEYIKKDIPPQIRSHVSFMLIISGRSNSWDNFIEDICWSGEEDLAIDELFRNLLNERREVIYDIYNDRCLNVRPSSGGVRRSA